MDLRTKTEHVNQAKKRQADLKIPPPARPSDALAERAQIPGLSYLEIRTTGRAFERHLLAQLSWPSWLRLVLLFLLGLRVRAIAILGREVLRPRGLVGIAVDTLDHSRPEIALALRALLGPGALPALVHCTQGKDRTGLVVALVLMVLGVPLRAIEHDYGLSDEGLAVERESRLVEIREIGLTEEFALVAPGMNRAIAEHLTTKYGGLDDYLDGIGFGEDQRRAMRDLLAY